MLEPAAQGIMATTDAGPLVGADLFCAGRIAVLHAMADIYARGGVPRWVLPMLVADHTHPACHVEAVMAGILRACRDEGAAVVGGHTMIGLEAIAGLTVLGTPRTGRLLSKRGAVPGDTLLLSKPLGVGLIVRGYKLGLADDAALQEAVDLMLVSNGPASQAAVDANVHAATDVSGFGLLGHLSEMLAGDLGACLCLDQIPLLRSLERLPSELGQTLWSEHNLRYATRSHRVVRAEPRRSISALLDPQTNGGLLVAADEAAAGELGRHGFTPIGRVVRSATIEIS